MRKKCNYIFEYYFWEKCHSTSLNQTFKELFNMCVQVKEGKRLKEFLEDYDDDRDDPKYYR